jgi:soluble lytic murein transglycosylase
VIYLFSMISGSRSIALVALIVGVMSMTSTVQAAGDVSAKDKERAAAIFRAIDLNKGIEARKTIARVSHPLLQKTLQWLLYMDVPGAANWAQMAEFIQENPGWPKLWTIRKNLEEMMSSSTPVNEIGDWYAAYPPVSARGNALLVKWLLSEDRVDEATRLVKKTWINGDFSRRDEKWFYRSFRKYMSREDHEARLDRLLWDGANWSARRMFGRVNNDLRMVAEARYLLRHMRGNVDKAIARVPEKYQQHVGLVYERLRWRRRKGKDVSARSLLDDPLGPAVGSVPRPDLWFKEREVLARRALSKGLITDAYNLVSEHGLTPKYASAYSTAEWMAGWIALRFLNEPEQALKHFTAMHEAVRYPISVARAAYWAGRASFDLNDDVSANDWFKKAAAYPTTFYGQLATAALPGDTAAIHLTDYSGIDATARLEESELTQVIHLLDSLDAQDRMRPFLQHLIDTRVDDPDWQVAVGKLAQAAGRADFGVRVGKAAVHKGTILPKLGYPMVDLPALPKSAIKPYPEQALVYALIRQESSYYTAAHSIAGARGLMQIMPGTAKVVSKSVGLAYSRDKLSTDPVYNLKLGQSYLSSVLDQYDGSYILALAAYNAGPRRAKAWIKAHGDPRDPSVDAVDWVEQIPFTETRNYVQRVMESLQVYRARIGTPVMVSQLAQDLIR